MATLTAGLMATDALSKSLLHSMSSSTTSLSMPPLTTTMTTTMTPTTEKTTTTSPPSDDSMEFNPLYSLVGVGVCAAIVVLLCVVVITIRHFASTRSCLEFKVLCSSYMRCQCLREECSSDGNTDPDLEQDTGGGSTSESSTTVWDPPPYRQALSMQRLDSTTISGEPPPLYSSLDIKAVKSENDEGDFCYVNFAMDHSPPLTPSDPDAVRNKNNLTINREISQESVLQNLQYPNYRRGDVENGDDVVSSRSETPTGSNVADASHFVTTETNSASSPNSGSRTSVTLQVPTRTSPAHSLSIAQVHQRIERVRMREPPSRLSSLEEVPGEEQLPCYDDVNGDILSRM